MLIVRISCGEKYVHRRSLNEKKYLSKQNHNISLFINFRVVNINVSVCKYFNRFYNIKCVPYVYVNMLQTSMNVRIVVIMSEVRISLAILYTLIVNFKIETDRDTLGQSGK